MAGNNAPDASTLFQKQKAASTFGAPTVAQIGATNAAGRSATRNSAGKEDLQSWTSASSHRII